MPDQTLVDKIRNENYPLKIYLAFENRLVISITTVLIKFIQDVYRYLEPEHFTGKLIIFTTLDDLIFLNQDNANDLFDKNILLNNSSNSLIIQLFQNTKLPLIWFNVNEDNIINSTNSVIYYYENKKECFYANGQKIDVINEFCCASIYSLQYHYLYESLYNYEQNKIKYSSCTIFNECWYDPNVRIYFKIAPEDIMQKSLKEYLSSSLRGVDVVREYNLGAGKPVDVRVYWKEANRSALIELKWLGQSKKENGELSTGYTNVRANDGMVQLKNYMDLAKQDTPTCITRSYLVVIDGRRRGVSQNITSINREDGMYYSDKELEIDVDKKYHETLLDFEKPIRMFSIPCYS